MSTINQYRREVEDYLRDGYGATDFEVTSGGRHNRLRFLLGDKPVSILLNDRNGAGGSSAADMKKQDIRRSLGEPTYPNAAPRVPRRLEDMTEGSVAHAAIDPVLTDDPALLQFHGHLAHYGSGRLEFTMPREVATVLPLGATVSVRYSKDMQFSIRRLTTGTVKVTPAKTGDGLRLRASCPQAADEDPFGRSSARYVIVGETVRVLVDDRMPPRARRGCRVRIKPALEPSLHQEETTLTEGNMPSVSVGDMRLILAEIARVERSTAHRLRRVKQEDGTQRWVWRAPDVTLEDAP